MALTEQLQMALIQNILVHVWYRWPWTQTNSTDCVIIYICDYLFMYLKQQANYNHVIQLDEIG